MLDFITSQFLFYIALAAVLFVPGYFLIMATRMDKQFSSLEQFVLAFGSSIAALDFLVILLGRSPLHITRASVLGAIALFCAACGAIFFYRQKRQLHENSSSKDLGSGKLSNRSTALAVLLLFLTIFINTIYFKDAIFPTTTDMGHHMYWTKAIVTTGLLPVYEKADISADFSIGKPAPIADFIIGEHLVFAAIALISGADFFSAFPVLVLFLVHIMALLAIFILARALFKESEHRDAIALIALLLIGPLYALASPQAKFASGGVIGNTIGNLFIPLAILLYAKAFSKKSSGLLAYALFISLAMAYTHHLSTFVFIFLSFFTVVAFAAMNYKTFLSDARGWLKIAVAPSVLAVLAAGAIFILAIYMPTYLNTKAIDTAVGAPSKATRMGLTLAELKTTAGEARFAFAVIGVLLLCFARKIGKYEKAFLIGWIGALTLMSLRPDWLLLDIPSNRIASYIVFPVAIIAAYMLAQILVSLKTSAFNKNYLSPFFAMVIFLSFMAFFASNGFRDNANALNTDSSTDAAIQTYAASEYLAARSTDQDVVLKDHNYLAGDSWIKLFFMRGYNYPLSRGFFKRYQDETKPREQCTNLMISTPNNQTAQRCYQGTGTDFIMVNPTMDSAQFQKLNSFWRVYSSEGVGIFYKSQ